MLTHEQVACRFIGIHCLRGSILINCDHETPELTEYPKLELAGGNAVTAMACIEGRATESGDLIVLLACWNQAMYIATPKKVVNLHVEEKLFGRIQKISLSPNQQFVACHTSEGWIVVLNTSFNKKVSVDLSNVDPIPIPHSFFPSSFLHTLD